MLIIFSLGRPRRKWEDNIKMDLHGGMDLIELAQDRDRWRAVVNAVMNLHKIRGISWLSEKLVASQGGLCSLELVS
jgi:hypothetical protein